VLFILTVAAAESAIGLAILVVLFRNLNTINIEDLDSLKDERKKGRGMMKALYLLVPLAPLAGALAAACSAAPSGAPGRTASPFSASWSRSWHRVVVLMDVLNGNSWNGAVYTWATIATPSWRSAS